MTVQELKTLLSQYPDDMKVIAEWELVQVDLDSSFIGVQNFKDGDALVIDVNQYYFKT